MSDGGNYGIIIRQLRLKAGMSVRKCSEKIGRGTGWLSEIENGTGTARLREREFDRIVEALGGAQCRDQFATWVATQKKLESTDRTLDGAVLKFIRIKKRMRLKDAAQLCGFSIARLSKIERGIIPVSIELRNRIMVAYGYSPSSFKNLSSDPVRSKAVPSRFKIEILIERMSDEYLDKLLSMAEALSNTTELS